MICSMTGFGQAGLKATGYRIQIDLKSVNHRYHEVMVRMPREWIQYEDKIKKRVQQLTRRGRIDVFITLEHETGEANSVRINWPLVEGYRLAAQQIAEKYQIADSLSLQELLRIPGLVQLQEEDIIGSADMMEQPLLSCLDDALQQLLSMRKAEGLHLSGDVAERLEVLAQIHREMQQFAPHVVIEYRTKLRQRLHEILLDAPELDESRFAAEIALYADRSNIDEELTRLSSHLEQSKLLLKSAEPVGRKFDFLIQEMNREVNTIGSKANHIELVNRVVGMKTELEKIREQVQNIE